MTFSEAAVALAGQTAFLLGWRPDDFWNATPAELAGILAAIESHDGAANKDQLTQLMQQFPDVRTETQYG